jgi:membrane-associated protease RseP (regulator of RpoE activity)
LVNRDGVQQKVTLQMADRRKVQEEARQQIDNGGGYGVPAQGFLTTTSGGGDAPSSGGFHLWGMGSSLKIGALVEPLSLQTAYVLGVPSGLMIKSVARKSAADAAGLKPFDVILQVGSDAIVTSSDWERTLRSSEGKPVQVEILRDRIKQLVLLQVDGKRH